MSRHPNFLLIMSDQHHAGFMGCAGNRIVRTPNLDALAGGGTRFTQAYCSSPLCVPSRMSFMTGRNPGGNEVWSNDDMLRSDIPTFAHALGAAGYETVLCGRMHFVGPDQRHGFERRIAGDLTPVHPGSLPPPKDKLDEKMFWATGQGRSSLQYSGAGHSFVLDYDEMVVSTCARFLKERTVNRGRPLCLVVGTYLPHCPFVIGKELFDEFLEKTDMPEWPAGYLDRQHPMIRRWRESRGLGALDRETARRLRAAYYGMVVHLDGLVGRILEALRQSALSDDTVVIYCSDHGEMAGEHGAYWKSIFYEGAVRVPLMISGGGLLPEGNEVHSVVSLMDIGATLLDLAGADPLPRSNGRSLRPLLSDPGAPWANETYSEHTGMLSVPPARMIRRDQWKLVRFHGVEHPQLFNLHDDPGELNDLGADPAYGAIRAELMEAVSTGWKPEAALAASEHHRLCKPLLAEWARQARVEFPDQWAMPEGVNRLDRMT